MPIYEYQCPSCGDVFEQLRPMSRATEPASCPSCRVDAPRKISRLARAAHAGEEDAGGDDFGATDFGGGGGHSHDHGMGHSH